MEEDLFVEISYDHPISVDVEKSIFEAYLFELNCSLNLSFNISSRPSGGSEWIFEKSWKEALYISRFRPLIMSKGTANVLHLYNLAVASQDLNVQLLYFTKAVEYVSQTVVRLQSHEAIRTKLLSPRALVPNAEFISEIEKVFEAQRQYKKDREAIKQTIVTCCEASELAKMAPEFLGNIRKISVESKLQEKQKALETLGYALYATRNQIAHAKANYVLTGDECPQDQLHTFVECLRIATQQVIRWYSFSPESGRLS